MKLEEVINTVFKYFENEMIRSLTGLQEVLFYSAKEAAVDSIENIKETISSNPVLRAIIASDKDGNIDIEKLARRIYIGIERKGSLTVEIPLYGTVCLMPDDINNIHRMLKEAEGRETY